MTQPSQRFTSIGGQAVIEGVMMRSPHHVAIAIRRPNSKIVVRSLSSRSFLHRFPIFKKPVLRGLITLMESLYQGIDALGFSASVATEGDDPQQGEELSVWAIVFSIFMAFMVGIALFVALPHLLTALLVDTETTGIDADSPLFHLIDGIFKVLFLLIYVYAISFMQDIYRVFQYHGAEHKSIYAFERGEELTVENAKKYSTLHPRCGTSFLLFLVLISIIAFSIVFPIFGLTSFSGNPVANHGAMILIKIVLMFPIAGLAYEFIKLCAFRMNQSSVLRTLIWPGMVLQRLTTREPDESQLEVALVALRQVLRLEKGIVSPAKQANTPLSDASAKGTSTETEEEFEISTLEELGRIRASVEDFPEV